MNNEDDCLKLPTTFSISTFFKTLRMISKIVLMRQGNSKHNFENIKKFLTVLDVQSKISFM